MLTKSCFDLWKEEKNQTGIVTFCKDLDQAIGNGISVGVITEFCGPPGSGKTQMCIQLAVNVQIPLQLGGLAGKAMFFDTNFGFSPGRLEEIAAACTHHCQRIVQIHRQDLAKSIGHFTDERILDGVYYKHINGCSEMLDALEALHELLKSGQKIKLIIIDSLSFLIRNNIENTLERIRIDHRILTKLHVLAHLYKCAVVITNDVTTRIDSNGTTNSIVIPAIGDSHSHKINQRIVLGQTSDEESSIFIASIEKSLMRPRTLVKFQITEAGIRRFRKK
ncbi:DNA repair protein RAD51 homolog 3 [Malaya genurostris]|uniref:DNA repair protein RAD51 homolog 3 n=1 Tax=Malaya genurostris TaxID=325434 RepID=UPI0026F38DDF|nr:DNA repair protein RAD51 homolog 3 [Malaya genurostris]